MWQVALIIFTVKMRQMEDSENCVHCWQSNRFFVLILHWSYYIYLQSGMARNLILCNFVKQLAKLNNGGPTSLTIKFNTIELKFHFYTFQCSQTLHPFSDL